MFAVLNVKQAQHHGAQLARSAGADMPLVTKKHPAEKLHAGSVCGVEVVCFSARLALLSTTALGSVVGHESKHL